MNDSPRRLRDLMSPWQRARYLLWRSMPFPGAVQVRLDSGEALILRREPARDLWNAYEIFVLDAYRPPRKLSQPIRRIVDVGANIGNSVAYFGARYPEALIDAFEPYPVHLRQLARVVSANGLQRRVKLHSANGKDTDHYAALRYIDAASQPNNCNYGAANLRHRVEYFFDQVSDSRIDLLKMNCWGPEYDILMNDRFASLNVRNLVLEWRAHGRRPDADVEISRRLFNLGWKAEGGFRDYFPGLRFGMVWGYRS